MQLKVQLDLKVTKDHEDIKENKVTRVHKVKLDPREPQA